jgi:hypothetical protein
MEEEAPIMDIRAQLRSPLATDRTTFVAPDIGTEVPTTSGGEATGDGGAVSKFGSMATMSCEDTSRVESRISKQHFVETEC